MAVVAASLSIVSANPARGDGGATPTSVPDPLATSLFQDAVLLIEKNEWKEGCAKFEASMALYAAPSTLLNIARCYEHDGKLSLAWSAYQRALVLNRETQGAARKQELDDVAKKGLADIEPRLPRVKIVMTGEVPAGLRVIQNGKDVPTAVLGTPIPVDPGQQSVVAEAPGFEPFTQTVTVKERDLVEIPVALKKRAAAPVIEKPTSRIPVWAWVSAGGGIALLAGAAAFRVDQAFVEGLQVGKCGEDVDKCPPKTVYDPAPDNERKNRDNALFATFGVLGVIGLGAGVAGFVMGQSAKPSAKKAAVVTPWIGPTGVSLSVGGRF